MRPRERMLIHGAAALTDAELLALLIGSGPRGTSALEVGTRILSGLEGSLHALGRCDPLRLRDMHGIGDATAVRICAAMEIGRRRMAQPSGLGERIARSRDIVSRFRPRLIDLDVEEFWALALSRANTAIADLLISRGGQSGTVVDPKVVFRKALSVRAAAVVLVHNHPSGNPKPSAADRTLTDRLCAAGKALDIPVLDHVIIAGMEHVSFADARLL